MNDQVTENAKPSGQSVLRRKARPSMGAKPGQVTDLAVLRRGIRKAADLAVGLNLLVTGAEEEHGRLADVTRKIKSEHMILLLSGPMDRHGIVLLDAAVRAAVIEMSTLGQVLSGVQEDRPPTQTDVVMLTPLIDHLLSQIAEQGSHSILGQRAEGFGFPRLLPTAAAAENALVDVGYHHYHLELELGDGAKTGTMDVFLPDPGGPILRGEVEQGNWDRNMRDTVLSVPAELEAVLHRYTVPLTELNTLKEGDLVPLPVVCLQNVRLMVGRGEVVARARLGQVNGMRAICVAAPGGKGPEDVFTLAKPPGGAAVDEELAREIEEFEAQAAAAQAAAGEPGVEAVDALTPVGAE